MTRLPSPAPMAEVRNATREQLDEEIRPAGQPVVLRGTGAHWPAVKAAQEGDEAFVAYARSFATPNPVHAIVGQPEINGRFFYTDDLKSLNFERGVSPLVPFLDRILRDREHPAPLAMAVQSELVSALMPGFERANRLDLLSAQVEPRAWIGNRVRVAPHYDLKENIGIVVAGKRRFTLFPPEQIANLYPGPFELTPAGTPVSLVELANPDLNRFPNFARAIAAAQVAELEPGDGIYIPYLWWHGVDSLSGVNLFVNYWWNEAAPAAAAPYEAMMLGTLAFRDMPPEQRAVWRLMFDHYVFGVNGVPGAHLPDHAKGVLGPLDSTLKHQIRANVREALSRP